MIVFRHFVSPSPMGVKEGGKSSKVLVRVPKLTGPKTLYRRRIEDCLDNGLEMPRRARGARSTTTARESLTDGPAVADSVSWAQLDWFDSRLDDISDDVIRT